MSNKRVELGLIQISCNRLRAQLVWVRVYASGDKGFTSTTCSQSASAFFMHATSRIANLACLSFDSMTKRITRSTVRLMFIVSGAL